MATPISPPPVSEKSPRTPRVSNSNPKGILNFGTPVKKPKKITRERTRHETPGSETDKTKFSATPDVVKEFIICLTKGWAPEQTSGNALLCGIYALSQSFKNMTNVEKSEFSFNVLKEGIASKEFKKFHKDVIKSRIEKNEGLAGKDLTKRIKEIMDHGQFGKSKYYSIEELSEFVRYLNKMHNTTYRVGVVSTTDKKVTSAYIVEGDDPLSELHYPILWLHNINSNHWESFGPNPSRKGRQLRQAWQLRKNVETVVNNGLYRVRIATQGFPADYTLTTLEDQWVFQVAPPRGLEPREGFIYVHTARGPNADSWRVVGKSTGHTIRYQEGYIPLANLAETAVSHHPKRDDGWETVPRKPTNFPKPPKRGNPPPGPTAGGPADPSDAFGGTAIGPGGPGCTQQGTGTTTTTPGLPGAGAGGQGPTGPRPTTPPGQTTVGPTGLPATPPSSGGVAVGGPNPPVPTTGTTTQLPPTPGSEGPGLRGPIVTTIATTGTTTVQGPGAQGKEPEKVEIIEIPVPLPPPTPRPKEIELNTPLTIKTFLQRRPFGPPQSPHATRVQSSGARPRLPPGRPKGRTLAELNATRMKKNDWPQIRFLNFFLADVPDADENGHRFGTDHDQPYHQDQVLLSLDDTYEPGVAGPVRVRTIDEDEGWVHSSNLRKITDPFGLDLNSATTQYSMDPNEAFREDLYPTSSLRGICNSFHISPQGTRQELIAGITAHRLELGVPLILYRVVEAIGVFSRDDLVRVPGDPLAHPDDYFRAFGLEPHKRGFVRGGGLVVEPRTWGARVKPHVHELTAPRNTKWAHPPVNVNDLVPKGSGLALHGMSAATEADRGNGPERETERDRREREAGLAPAATVNPTRHPGQLFTAKDGSPSFFKRLLPPQTGTTTEVAETETTDQAQKTAKINWVPGPTQTGTPTQTTQTGTTDQTQKTAKINWVPGPTEGATKRKADEELGGDRSRRRINQPPSQCGSVCSSRSGRG
ncbi:hypothetical protein O988_05246 [Pseudogymnoascus sp. VKM F-3808]|nr:hypothetical protein O988_05246 [Pseudogymnoascus sp. VKM F-3808]